MGSLFLPCLVTVIALVVVTLSVICKQNRRAQYFIKNFLFAGWYMLTALLVIPIAVFRPGDSINMGWWSFLVKYLQTTWLFDIHIEKHGEEELEYDGPCVIVCNHQTAIDQVAILYVWPRGRSTFMAKKSLKYAGTMGIAGILSGLIFVDRQNKQKAKSETTKECTEFVTLKKGKLWVYPEGTRSGNRQEHMLPFKKGAFHIAVQAQVPIIPVVLSAYKDMYSDKKKRFGKVDITLTVLPKVTTKGLTADDVTSLSERVRMMMLETFYKTSPHIERPVTIETKDNLETQSNITTEDKEVIASESSPEIETLKTKTDELDKNAGVENNQNGEESKLNVQSSDDLVTASQNTQANAKPPLIVEGQSSSNYSANQNILGADSVAHSELSESTLLVELEEPKDTENNEVKVGTEPKNENDDSPSSQASSDSFVFVNSSKLDGEANSADFNNTHSSSESNGQEESKHIQEISENDLKTESNSVQKQDNIETEVSDEDYNR